MFWPLTKNNSSPFAPILGLKQPNLVGSTRGRRLVQWNFDLSTLLPRNYVISGGTPGGGRGLRGSRKFSPRSPTLTTQMKFSWSLEMSWWSFDMSARSSCWCENQGWWQMWGGCLGCKKYPLPHPNDRYHSTPRPQLPHVMRLQTLNTCRSPQVMGTLGILVTKTPKLWTLTRNNSGQTAPIFSLFPRIDI